MHDKASALEFYMIFKTAQTKRVWFEIFRLKTPQSSPQAFQVP